MGCSCPSARNAPPGWDKPRSETSSGASPSSPSSPASIPPIPRVYSREGLSDFLKDLGATDPDMMPAFRAKGHARVSELVESAERHLKNAKASRLRATKIRKGCIHDTYDISEDMLGHGAFGVVFRATHLVTDDTVAIKVIPTASLDDTKFGLLFGEVENVLHMDHPNIIRIFEVYEEDDMLQLVMEHCAGHTLYDSLAQRRYTEREAAAACKQMVAAVRYIHSHNVCHRDLKLENWMYSVPSSSLASGPGAVLKLIDFGFSRVLHTGTRMTAVLGTSYYVAPEVMQGDYDVSCDLWSLGVMAYMLLVGAPPFSGVGAVEVLANVRARPKSYQKHADWKKLSASARGFVDGLLRLDPSQRATAAEILKHEWLPHSSFEGHAENTTVDKGVLESIRKFAELTPVRRTVLSLIVSHFPHVELVRELEAQFEQVDFNCDGSITVDELAEILHRNLGVEDAEAREIFARLDCLNAHEINISEFIAAAAARELLQDKYILQAFEWFDRDNDGFINLEDLSSVLGDFVDGSPTKEVLPSLDANADGKIDYADWRAYMLAEEEVRPEPSTASGSSTCQLESRTLSPDDCMDWSSPEEDVGVDMIELEDADAPSLRMSAYAGCHDARAESSLA